MVTEARNIHETEREKVCVCVCVCACVCVCVYVCVCAILGMLWVATGNPNVDVVLRVVLGFLECEMSHGDWTLRRWTPVNHLHLPDIVELERADAIADQKTEDLRDEMEGGDGERIDGEGTGDCLVRGGVVKLPFLVA